MNRLAAPLAAIFGGVPPSWQGVTEPFLRTEAGQRLCAFVDARVAAGALVYPAPVFRALQLTPPSAVRVVILGQDPYHGPGQAQGLAFSVGRGMRLPPSLRNILAEVAADCGRPSTCAAGDLSGWAEQGVLLLNTLLTVEDGAPQSHAGQGWEALTDALVRHVALHRAPVCLLWGAAAQRQRSMLESAGCAVLAANHPSPLAARRPPVPFIGCRHFSAANALLEARDPPSGRIDW